MPLFRPLLLIQPPEIHGGRMTNLGGLLKRDYGLPGTPFACHRLHATLQEFPAYEHRAHELIALVRTAASTVKMAPFEVTFDHVQTWEKSKALVLLGDKSPTGLVALQRSIGAALTNIGLGSLVRKSFTPHITLIRGRGYVEDLTVQSFQWTVHEFALVYSLVGEGEYEWLNRWPLRSH